MSASRNQYRGCQSSTDNILILWSDLLTKNRGIDWSTDFRYRHEVGLAWQRSPSKSLRLLVDLPYKPRYRAATAAASREFAKWSRVSCAQWQWPLTLSLSLSLSLSLREFKIEPNNSRFACCTRICRGMPGRYVNDTFRLDHSRMTFSYYCNVQT